MFLVVEFLLAQNGYPPMIQELSMSFKETTIIKDM